jgi:hypothetical protein
MILWCPIGPERLLLHGRSDASFINDGLVMASNASFECFPELSGLSLNSSASSQTDCYQFTMLCTMDLNCIPLTLPTFLESEPKIHVLAFPFLRTPPSCSSLMHSRLIVDSELLLLPQWAQQRPLCEL